jgi:hypothetical protein
MRQSQQLLDRHDIAMLVTHHRYVIEAIHVADTLIVGFALYELFCCAMQQSNVRIRLLDGFTLDLEDETQHAVGRRMLRTEVHCIALDLSHLSARP